MQYLQKLVIKISLILLICLTFSCNKKDENYIVLNTVLSEYKNDDIKIILNKNGDFDKDGLERYYDNIYIKSNFNEMERHLDSVDSIATKKGTMHIKKYFYLKPLREHWFNDSLFTKKEIEYLISQKGEINWETSKIIKNNVEVIDFENVKNQKNSISISKPLFTSNNKYAILIINKNYGFPQLLIYEKKDNKWEKYTRLVDYW